MTKEDYHETRATDETIKSLYQVVSAIDHKVEEILDEMKDLVELQSDRSHSDYYGRYSKEDYY